MWQGVALRTTADMVPHPVGWLLLLLLLVVVVVVLLLLLLGTGLATRACVSQDLLCGLLEAGGGQF
jgi:hypothetical protein